MLDNVAKPEILGAEKNVALFDNVLKPLTFNVPHIVVIFGILLILIHSMTIVMLYFLETPIVNNVRFCQYIRPYKLSIDDLFLMWTGPTAVLCDLRRALATADEAISLDWGCYESHQDAVDPSVYGHVNYLDLDSGHEPAARGVSDACVCYFHYLSGCYSDPTTSRATPTPLYSSGTSFHGRHTFQGWPWMGDGGASQASDSQ